MSMLSSFKIKPAVVVTVFISVGTLIITSHMLLSQRRARDHEVVNFFHEEQAENTRSMSEDKTRKEFGSKGEIQKPDIQDLKTPFHCPKSFTPRYTLGAGRPQPVSIVIGIPTVRRVGVNYLYDTLNSIFSNMYPANEDDVAVVVFLAETDMDIVSTETKYIHGNFTREVNNGLLQVIAPPTNIYPNFEEIPLTLGDSRERVKWRSKLVIDGAHLMLYCKNKARYYLMLEDDVLAAKGYIGATKKIAKEFESKPFVFMSLANFNVVGKFFRSSTIPIWVSFFLSFYNLKPYDLLMFDFMHVSACYRGMNGVECTKRIRQMEPRLSPGLFQHTGMRSSLKGETQNAVDSEFPTSAVSENTHKNPDAEVTTTFKQLSQASVLTWYNDGGGMVHKISFTAVEADNYIKIHFTSAQTVSKILIKSGSIGGSERVTENSYVIETMTISRLMPINSVQYKTCSGFDRNGVAECNLNHSEIFGLRLRATKASTEQITLSLIYIKYLGILL